MYTMLKSQEARFRQEPVKISVICILEPGTTPVTDDVMMCMHACIRTVMWVCMHACSVLIVMMRVDICVCKSCVARYKIKVCEREETLQRKHLLHHISTHMHLRHATQHRFLYNPLFADYILMLAPSNI